MTAASSAIVTVLFAGLWQGALIAAVTLAMLACARGASAATRHAILWCAFVAVAVVPAAIALPHVFASPSASPAAGVFASAPARALVAQHVPPGHVTGAEIATSSTLPDLDRAALASALKGTYTPRIVNCTPVASTYVLRSVFSSTFYPEASYP